MSCFVERFALKVSNELSNGLQERKIQTEKREEEEEERGEGEREGAVKEQVGVR